MSGSELAEKLLEQVMEHGAEIELAEVLKIEKKEGFFAVLTDSGAFEGKSVIIATGSKPRRLGVPREDEFVGRGISYCAVCDGAFYHGSDIAIVGGGNTALQEAVMLSEHCPSVSLIQNLPNMTGEKRLVDILSTKPNVKIYYSSVVTELLGEGELSGIRIKNTESGAEQTIAAGGVFVAIGQKPENEIFLEVARLDEFGYFASGEDCATQTTGIFVAGDCRAKRIRQITTAASDGTIAALAACAYLDKI